MGVTDGKIELVTLDGGAESHALDLKVATEPRAYPCDHVVDERTGQAVKGADIAGVAGAGQNSLVLLDGKGDFLGKGPAEFALGALDGNQASVGDGDFDLVGEGDGSFSDT